MMEAYDLDNLPPGASVSVVIVPKTNDQNNVSSISYTFAVPTKDSSGNIIQSTNSAVQTSLTSNGALISGTSGGPATNASTMYIDATGLHAFDGSGRETVRIESNTGNAKFSGSIMTDTGIGLSAYDNSGTPRVIIGATDGLNNPDVIPPSGGAPPRFSDPYIKLNIGSGSVYGWDTMVFAYGSIGVPSFDTSQTYKRGEINFWNINTGSVAGQSLTDKEKIRIRRFSGDGINITGLSLGEFQTNSTASLVYTRLTAATSIGNIYTPPFGGSSSVVNVNTPDPSNSAVLELRKTFNGGSSATYPAQAAIYISEGGSSASTIFNTSGTLSSVRISASGYSSWVSPAYSASWQSLSTINYNSLGYIKYPDGTVGLRGVIQRITASAAAGAVIYQLPSDCYPVKRNIFVCSSTNGPSRVDVFANGNITIEFAMAINDWISLDGIRFDTI